MRVRPRLAIARQLQPEVAAPGRRRRERSCSRGAIMPGRLEAELLQHPARGRIVEEVRGLEPIAAQALRAISTSAAAGFGGEAAAPMARGRSNSRARQRRTAAGRGRRSRPAAARRRSARRSGSEGRAGSRGAARKASASRKRVGPGRGRQVADDHLVGNRAVPAPGRPRPSRVSAAVARSARTFVFSSSPAARQARVDSFGRRFVPFKNKEGRGGGCPLLPFGFRSCR